MRYLFLILVVVGAVLIWRRWLGRVSGRDGAADSGEGKLGTMVQCRVCGVYLPEEESLSVGHFHYCSVSHRDQDSQRQS